jgi:predicted HicB family RNase H-like nuclease
VNDQINIRCSTSFKEDVAAMATAKDQSVAEYIREATRRQMQRDVVDQDQ